MSVTASHCNTDNKTTHIYTHDKHLDPYFSILRLINVTVLIWGVVQMAFQTSCIVNAGALVELEK